jgi:hypothetical protein
VEDSRLGIDASARLFSGIDLPKGGESLFDYTKSNNDGNEVSKEISGNLLSSIMNGKQSKQVLSPLLPVEEGLEMEAGFSGFNLESVVLANMEKKDMHIRAVESEIHPFDEHSEHSEEEEQLMHSPGSINKQHLPKENEEDDLLLDSAFNRSFASQPISKIVRKESNKDLANESKRSKMSEKRSRIYPTQENYKFIELFLIEVEFKENKEKV